MMIDLTVDHDPGDKYGDGPYTHVQIARTLRDDPNIKFLSLEVQYGTESGGSFVPNTTGYPPDTHSIQGADYDTYKALATNNPETIGDAEDRCRHQILLDLSLYSGTLV
jgi:hypothetical protein